MSVILVTGAATGIGRLTSRELCRAGHTVYASMRDPDGRNAAAATALVDEARADGRQLRVIDLDVASQEAACAAIATVVAEAGSIDVLVHNAGHLFLGYMEAFTAEQIETLFDVNVLGAHRVNRAALPYMRSRGSGTLVYVGSTTTVSVPPFLGPYVMSKMAFDALAQVTRYEVNPFGIETTIVMPGAFTSGTDHFANASRASDHVVEAAYARLDPLVARNEEATSALFDPAVAATPESVATEIARVIALPWGQKPFRTVIDFTQSHVSGVNNVAERESSDFLNRLGYADLLTVGRLQPPS